MIDSTVLASDDGFGVADVHCTRAPRGFGHPERSDSHILVAVRRGAFVRRVRGRDVMIDGSVAYLSGPDSVDQFAHPVAGGDVCTAIFLSAPLLAGLAGGDPSISAPALPMDAASEFALRQLTVAARNRDPAGEVAERVVRLVAALLARLQPERVASGRPPTAAARRLLAERAREAMHADPAAALVALARRVGCSPHHLSRVFSQVNGVSVAAYRNRLRVSRALERLADGETSLAALAADLGFADHAHLTRAIRAATGRTPSECRGLLGRSSPRAGSG